ncbi:hypothetical protein MRX96_030440 [Rhipicephalus microplus]
MQGLVKKQRVLLALATAPTEKPKAKERPVLSDAVKRRVTENVLNWCTKVRAVKRVKRARVVEAVVEGIVTHAVRRQRLRLVLSPCRIRGPREMASREAVQERRVQLVASVTVEVFDAGGLVAVLVPFPCFQLAPQWL